MQNRRKAYREELASRCLIVNRVKQQVLTAKKRRGPTCNGLTQDIVRGIVVDAQQLCAYRSGATRIYDCPNPPRPTDKHGKAEPMPTSHMSNGVAYCENWSLNGAGEWQDHVRPCSDQVTPAVARTAAEERARTAGEERTWPEGLLVPPTLNPIAPNFGAIPRVNCDSAVTQIARLICSTQSLVEADRRVAEAYAGALAFSTEGKRLRAEQRAWLTERDSARPDVTTLTLLYAKRLEEVESQHWDTFGAWYAKRQKGVAREELLPKD
jgi:uncharacterized protein YecT (DUF1311 family)